MRDIDYQLKKATKTPTDPKTVVPEEYHKFLDVFSKEASDTLSEYLKYNHRIWFLEGYKDHGNNPLWVMSKPKLQFVKKFVEEHLKKGFIKASSALCLSFIMLAVKLSRGVRFCVDYRRLNKLIVCHKPKTEFKFAILSKGSASQIRLVHAHKTNSHL